jgi:hypothetical protein
MSDQPEKIGSAAYQFRKEMAAQNDVLDVGIGTDLREKSGLDFDSILSLVSQHQEDFKEGLTKIHIHVPTGQMYAFVKRFGNMIDIGTREDMIRISPSIVALCDMISN